MVSDRDGFLGNWFGDFLKDCYEIKLIRTPPRTPICNALIERWHRTYREEVLDHSFVFGRKDLLKLTFEFVSYYNTQ
jgi:transposase InsO family protein